MNKAAEIISKETAMRAVYGNIRTLQQAKANITYMFWMHPELEDKIAADGLLDNLEKAIENYFEAICQRMGTERVIEDALIAEYGWRQ